MPTSIRLDAKTERILKRLELSRHETRSEVIREAIVAYDAKSGSEGKRPIDLVRPLLGCAKGGPPDLSSRTGAAFLDFLKSRKKRRRR